MEASQLKLHVVGKSACKEPQVGDTVALHLDNLGWIFGRVASLNASCSPFPDLKETGILLYLFRGISQLPEPPDVLPVDQLLCPPLIVDSGLWRRELVLLVANRPFRPGELLEPHCFEAIMFTRPRYFDELGNELPAKVQPCGLLGITSEQGVERRIADALGLTVPPESCPPDPASPPDKVPVPTGEPPEYEVTLTIPPAANRDHLDLNDLEERLIRAVEKAGAGQWEGHGTDLETGSFDSRFLGPDVSAMVNAMRPVLKRAAKQLPPGWYLTWQAEGSSQET